MNPNNIKCELCENEEDAVSFCQDCVQYSCAGCQRAHKKIKSAATHEFVSIEAALKGKLKEKLAHCVKHPVQLLNSYCGKCNEVVCTECAVENHTTHGAQKLEGIIVTQKEELEALITKVRPFLLFFFLLFLIFVHLRQRRRTRSYLAWSRP